MQRITGLIHVCNHERQVGRALLSLRPCDEVFVVDHGSRDRTLSVAREHGARIIPSVAATQSYAHFASYDWIFCLSPCEALAEDLEASLLEWKLDPAEDEIAGYNVGIREQTGTEWKLLRPELRFVNRMKVRWTGRFPAFAANPSTLEGYILRFPDEEG